MRFYSIILYSKIHQIQYNKIMKKFLLLLLTGGLFFAAAKADDLSAGTVIRDAEIESILHSYTDPLFRVAKLNPKDLRLVIVVNRDVNASATFNTTIILFTGFLLKTESVQEVIGVLAHEIGHLAGQHLVSLVDAVDNAQKMSLLGALAGVTLGLLTGNPQIGIFSVMGGHTSAHYSFAHFNQGQESAADRMAIRFLNDLCWPVEGLESFLRKLLSQELLRDTQQDPYLRTHPLTKDRVNMVQHLAQISCTKPFSHDMLANYQILKMKLEAFLGVPSLVLEKYQGDSFLNRYAQAIAYYRLSDSTRALQILDELLKIHDKNAFLWELKGQILYENGKLKESVGCYEKAVALKPAQPLLLLGLAQSLIALEDKKVLLRAESLLEKAREFERENGLILHYLSVVYGRQNKMGKMALALAEKEALLLNWPEAKQQAERALTHLKAKDKSFLRAHDLKNQATQEMNSKTKTESF